MRNTNPLIIVVGCLALVMASPAYASLTCTETPVSPAVNLLWAGASPNDVSTLNGSTATPGHLQGRLKQCIPDGSVEGEQGTFEYLPPQAGDSAFFVGEINGPNSVAFSGPTFNFVSLRMGNANFTGSLDANTVVIQDSQLESKMNFNGVDIFAQDLILIDSNDGEEIPDLDLHLTFDGGGLISPKDIIIGAGGRAITQIDMDGAILDANNLSIQPVGDGGGIVDLNFNASGGTVKNNVLIGEVKDGTTDISIDDGSIFEWAKDGGFTTIGHSGIVNMEILNGSELNTHETFMGFQKESDVLLEIDSAKWTTGNLAIGGFGQTEVKATLGAELASKNTTIGSFHNTAEGHEATVTLADDAKWTVDGFLSIGSEGQGKLVLNDDSIVNVTGATILGVLDNSHGILEVSSGDSFNAQTTLEVGRSGEGEMTVKNGGHVDVAGDMFVGTFENGEGEVMIEDGGLLTIDGNFNIGNGTPGSTESPNGKGVVTVKDGGAIEIGENSVIRVGRREGSEGFLTLQGANSQLLGGNASLVQSSVQVGLDGTGRLSLLDGALFGLEGQNFTLGINEKGKGLLSVQGNSVFKANDLIVGDKGKAEVLVDSGGKISTEGDLIIGKSQAAASITRVMLASGDATRIEIGRDLIIGDESDGELHLKDGAKLDFQGATSNIILGRHADSDGELQLDGAASNFTQDVNLKIGDEGHGRLTLMNGAVFTMGSVTLGEKDNSIGEIKVQDEGSLFEIQEDFLLGQEGFGQIGLENGGDMKTGAGGAGFKTSIGDKGSDTSVVSVGSSTGDSASDWTALSDIVMGNEGQALVNVNFRGKIDAQAAGITLGKANASKGQLNIGMDVDDPDATRAEVVYKNLTVGEAGEGVITLAGGGTLRGVDGGSRVVLGGSAGSKGHVQLEDASQWILNGPAGLTVGDNGTGQLNLASGAKVSMDALAQLILGAEAGGKGALEIDGGFVVGSGGAASQFLSGDDVVIGLNGEGRVDIFAGGELKPVGTGGSSTSVGESAGGKGFVSVRGEDSTWSTGDLTVGGAGSAGVEMLDEAIVQSQDVTVRGNASNPTTVTMSDARWDTVDLDMGNLTALNLNQGAQIASADITMAGNAQINLDNSNLSAFNMTLGNAGTNLSVLNNADAHIDTHLKVNGAVNTTAGFVTVGNDAYPATLGAVQVNPGGKVSGTGKIFGDLIVKGGGSNQFGGTVSPGNSPGTLIIDGRFILEAGGILDLEAGGTTPGSFDQLLITGDAQFDPGSFIKMSFLNNYLPKAGDLLPFIQAEEGIAGLTADLFLFPTLKPGFEFNLRFVDGEVTLAALSDAQSVVPEPATMVLLGAGLLGGSFLRRKRTRS